MLISAEDVVNYTVFQKVKQREPLLKHDIIQAEAEVFQFCGHKFSDAKYTPLPEQVKLALIKLSEYYALINSDEARVMGKKSESIGKYSYTLADGTEVQKPILSALLADYVETPTVQGRKTRMRMFSL